MNRALWIGFVSALGLAVACGGSGGDSSFGTGGSGAKAGTGGKNTGGSGNSAATGGSGNAAATGGTGNAAGTGGTGNTAGDGGPSGCKSNADCANDPGGPTCNTANGKCVGCVAAGDCPQGQWCDTSKQTCGAGCESSAGCTAPTPYCDTTNHQCHECLKDTDCAGGKICVAGACADGCSATQPCPNGTDTCCVASCHDVQTDVNNCGACGTVCPQPANSTATCTAGACGMGACAAGFDDCNKTPLDGCEWNTAQNGPCVCTPNATQGCYTGPAGTQGVGACKAGTQTCDASGTFWGPCLGQIVPAPETCTDGIDHDCNGVANDVPDIDGDGWTACNGDCCETTAQCSKPTKVNPGAYEVVNNGVDDDCDPTTSDTVAPADCQTTAKFSGVTGSDMAKAMELCQFTTANPPLPQKKWGVIAATQLYANGATPAATDLANIQNWQDAVLINFGTGGVVPQKGATLAGMSSGRMRDAGDPGWVLPIPGSTYTSAITFPGGPPLSTYVNAHGGNLLPGKCGATVCPVGSGANDSTLLRLQIRVPTNALSFSYNLRFFSAEYQTYQCTTFNDYFLAMLTTGAAGIPADHNISFDALNNPISVNNGFFQDCGGNGKNCGTCPSGTGPLAGTGMDQVAGGGTNWLTTTAPIVPGEVMTLELTIFDVSDHIYDSLILLDNFQWSLDPSGVGTTG